MNRASLHLRVCKSIHTCRKKYSCLWLLRETYSQRFLEAIFHSSFYRTLGRVSIWHTFHPKLNAFPAHLLKSRTFTKCPRSEVGHLGHTLCMYMSDTFRLLSHFRGQNISNIDGSWAENRYVGFSCLARDDVAT